MGFKIGLKELLFGVIFWLAGSDKTAIVVVSGRDLMVAAETFDRPAVLNAAAIIDFSLDIITRPSWRGLMHVWAFPLSVIAGAVLFVGSPAGYVSLSSAVYAITCSLLFAVSGIYNRWEWSPKTERRLKRLDHSNIFLMIAGTYTPIVGLSLTGPARTLLLTAVWVAALLGTALKVCFPDVNRKVSFVLYGLVVCAAIPVLGDLASATGGVVIGLIVLGMVLSGIGGVMYTLRLPGRSCARFGWHEWFHLFIVGSWACFYVAVSIIVYRL